MKKLTLLTALLFLFLSTAIGQAPTKMSCQAVVRDNMGHLVTNQNVGIQISILQGSATGTCVYSETQTISTNENGLISLEIGTEAGFDGIDWSAGPYFIKTETDPGGGSNYTIEGVSELLSVPYAMYSANGTPGTGIENTVDNGDGTITFYYSDGTNFTTSDLTGPEGPPGPVAGSDTQVIFNNSGNAAGSNNLTWNNSSHNLNVAGMINSTNATVTSLGGGGNQFVTTNDDGLLSAEPFSGTSGSGTNHVISKWTGTNSLGNSLISDDGTSVAVNSGTYDNYQFLVYRIHDPTLTGGQYTNYSYRTRSTAIDGTGYLVNESNSALGAHNYWGDEYSFGVAGWSYNDYTRTGGVFGGCSYTSYWGALGYKSSASSTYGVYASSTYGSGAGKMSADNESACIGGGFFSDYIGLTSQGNVIGQLNSGDLFAQYNIGDVYTSGKNIELVKTGTKVKPLYQVSALESTIYFKGNSQLENGTAFVEFSDKYAALLGNAPVVTITPNAECNGVYVSSVSKNGFTVRELMNGTSNAAFSWIAVGERSDNTIDEKSLRIVCDPQFDDNVKRSLNTDSNLQRDSFGSWWDGNSIRFGTIPATAIPQSEDKKME
jgi:hypothetical protein